MGGIWQTLFAAHALHASKSLQPRTAQQIEQQSLGIILLMMPHCYGVKVKVSNHCVEPLVAQAAGCHLDALASLFGFSLGVEVFHEELYTALQAQLAHKFFIAVALVAAHESCSVLPPLPHPFQVK